MSSVVALDNWKIKDGESIKLTIAETLHVTKTIEVTDAESYERAACQMKGLVKLCDIIEEYWADDVAAAHKLHKSLTTKRGADLDVVRRERQRLTGLMLTWKRQEEERQREEEARLNAENRARAEALALEEAATLEAQGQHDLAAAVVEQATSMPAPVVVLPSSTPKVQGVATVERWEFRIKDENAVPREYCSPDPRKLRAVVNALKGSTRIPGVEVFRNDSMRVSR